MAYFFVANLGQMFRNYNSIKLSLSNDQVGLDIRGVFYWLLFIVPVYIRSIRVLGSQPQDVIGSSNTTSTNNDKQWNQLQCVQN